MKGLKMGSEAHQVELRFEGLSAAEAGTRAGELRRELKGVAPEIEVHITKDEPENMDLGATVVLILGTPAILAVAKGIAAYLQRARGRLSITADGKVIAEGISGEDAARIAEALSPDRK